MFGNSDDNAGQPQDQSVEGNGDTPTMETSTAPSAPATPAADLTSYNDNTQPAGAPAMDSPAATSTTPSQGNEDELLNIKQQALQQLAPLVSHLDQTPEEEFRTTMMMIQASDNQELIPKAYEAAQKITDEKTKAQALLDIVNEINYFTQHHEDQEPGSK